MASEKEEVPESPDIYFEPLVNLPPVEIKTLEENEDEMIKLRARLFRYDSAAEPAEWKERGVGDVKILRNRTQNTCRVLMRRDKTLKICANHYVLPQMELKPNCGSDRAWVWSSPSDYADEEAKSELLAIRFANSENAQKFKEKFEEAKKIMSDRQTLSDSKDKSEKENGVIKVEEDTDAVATKLEELSVKDNNKDTDNAESTSDKDKSSESSKEITEEVER